VERVRPPLRKGRSKETSQPLARRGTARLFAMAQPIATEGTDREYPRRDQKKQAVWFRGLGGESRCAVRIANDPEEERTTWKRYPTPFPPNPQQHFFNGAIAFMAGDAGTGNVNFSITANANYSNLFYKVIGNFLKAGENWTWNNLLSNLQRHCQPGSAL